MNKDSYVYHNFMSYKDVLFICKLKSRSKLKPIVGNTIIISNFSKTFIESYIHLILKKKMNKRSWKEIK